MVLAGAAQARDPEPVVRIPLEPLGYQTMVPEFLLAGSSMLTVDFVDEDHLLITFGVRRLMKREPNDPAQMTMTGRWGRRWWSCPRARCWRGTEWRLHDHWQYLWAWAMGGFCCGCATV